MRHPFRSSRRRGDLPSSHVNLDNMDRRVHIKRMPPNVGRPLEFDPEAALEAAMQQFWSKGYEHTSLQALLDAMQLSKSSLYQSFGGKQDLFRRCVARYTDQLSTRLREGLAAAPSGRSFIESFLLSILEETKDVSGPRGCLVMNTATEFAQNEPDIAQDITQSIQRFRNVLEAAVQRAQREGDIPADRNAKALANYLVTVMTGLKTQAKAGADAKFLKGVVAVALQALD